MKFDQIGSSCEDIRFGVRRHEAKIGRPDAENGTTARLKVEAAPADAKGAHVAASAQPAPSRSTVTSMKFMAGEPMKPATKSEVGRS